MRRGLWWLGWLHDSLLVLMLVVGGPIACIVGLVKGDWRIAGRGALAAAVGLVWGYFHARDAARAP